MQVRSLGFATELMVPRLAGSEAVDAGDHFVLRTATNPNFWWSNFLLAAGSSRLDAALDAFRQAFPTAGDVAIGVDGTEGAVPASATSCGAEPDASVVLAVASDELAPRRFRTPHARRLAGGGHLASSDRTRRVRSSVAPDGNPTTSEIPLLET